MRNYIVFYEPVTDPEGKRQVFHCQADDKDHAIEQCLDAEPGAFIVSVCVQVL